MPFTPATQRTIVPGLSLVRDSEWRAQVELLDSLNVEAVALLFSNLSVDERRELYRLLERTKVKTIPYVALQNDMENWELDYLTSKYATQWFSCVASDTAYAFMATLPQYLSRLLVENPLHHADLGAFTEQALNRSEAAGVCLNLASLERKRLSERAAYEAMVFVLDHHPIPVSKISSVPVRWYNRLFSNPERPGHLTGLNEVHYLKHFPANFMAPIIVMELENTIDEQLEICQYLSFLIKK